MRNSTSFHSGYDASHEATCKSVRAASSEVAEVLEVALVVAADNATSKRGARWSFV